MKSKRIPQSLIDYAVKKNACFEAIEWLRAKPRTFAELVNHNLAWANWAIDRLAIATARKAYWATTAQAQKAYNTAIATARKAYWATTAQAQKAYNTAIATAREACRAVIAQALEKAFRRSGTWR